MGIGRRFLSLDALPVLTAMIVLFFFFGLYEPRFFRTFNLLNVLRNSSYLVIIASGQMLPMIIGGFDLSVGAIVALASISSALTMVGLTEVMPDQLILIISIGIMAGLFVGGVVGLFNGLCIALLKVSPFVVTLGTLSIAQGIAFYTTHGIPIYGMPEAFTSGFGGTRWFYLPVPFYITVVIVVAIWLIMNWTRMGRYMYAIGGNIQAARVSGIQVTNHLVKAYTMCGVLAALTGVLLTARVGSGEGTLGGEFLLESITAAVLGGVSIGGGVGRVEFVIVGAVFLSLITNGMNLIRVDSKLQTIAVGILLILAITLDQLRRRGANR
jgi:ribose transport system permease protein